jgi:regulator of ribonuclease activity A
VRCFEDNVLLKQTLSTPGLGRVLVVDGGGSLRRALVGDQLAAAGAANGWAGVIVHGAIRDARIVGRTELGVLALGTVPRKTEKRGAGEAGVVLALSGVTVAPGEWVYADEDGWIVAAERLHPV